MKTNNITLNSNMVENKKIKTAPVAFKGGLGTGKKLFKDLCELTPDGTMTEKLFLVNACMFLLGGRLLKSRDKNEVRETATRDVPTIFLAVLGVPVIGNLIAKLTQRKSGFTIINKDKSIFSIKSIAISKNKLETMYTYNESLHSKFEGFMQRFDSEGGNLKKIFSSLGDEFKSKLKDFSANNKDFMKELLDKKELKQLVEDEFKKVDNNASKQAAFKRLTSQSFAGFAFTIALIGIAIPKINILITEILSKKKAMKAKEINSDKPSET